MLREDDQVHHTLTWDHGT